MPLTIRPLHLTAVPAVAALADEFADYLRHLGDTGPHRLTAEVLQRDGFGPQPAFHGLVAEDESGTLAGYLLYTLGYDADLAARTIFIIDLYVSPTTRRQGAGRALLAAVTRAGQAVGAAYLFWAVLKGNQLAADFYVALGAQSVPDLDFMTLNLS